MDYSEFLEGKQVRQLNVHTCTHCSYVQWIKRERSLNQDK